jgi:hypothetical protein
MNWKMQQEYQVKMALINHRKIKMSQELKPNEMRMSLSQDTQQATLT